MRRGNALKENVTILGITVAVAFLFTLPIFHNINYWGIQDWDLHLTYHGVIRETIVKYHQFPLWNPYYNGGMPLLASPATRVLSPTLLPVLLFGELIGIKIEIWLCLVIGIMGVYLLARYLRMEIIPSYLSAIVYMMSGLYVLNLCVGVPWIMSMVYIPWAFMYFLRGFDNWRFSLLSGVFLTFIFFSGGHYVLPITILFFFFYSLFSLSHKRWKKVLQNLVLTLGFCLSVGAIKFIPSLLFLKEYPRKITDYSGYSVKILFHSLLDRDQLLVSLFKYPKVKGFWEGRNYGWDENGMYIGILPFLLFLVGLINPKKDKKIVFSFWIFLWLAFGNRITPSLWNFIHRLPVFDSMRVAQRFRYIFLLCMSLLTGYGVSYIKEKVRHRFRNPWIEKGIMYFVLSFVFLDLLAVNSPLFDQAFIIPPLKVSSSSEFCQIWKLTNYDSDGWLLPGAAHTYSSWTGLYPAFLAHMGTIQGYGHLRTPRNPLPRSAPNYKGEVYIEGTEGRVKYTSWSPNRLKIKVEVKNKGYLIINQNFYPGWKSKDKSKKILNIKGLLGLSISPQDSLVEIYYLPIDFLLGTFITILSIFFTIFLLLPISWRSKKI